jgi:FkbM family methyltransferase
MDAILSSLDRASKARPNESWTGARYGRLFLDHARRSAQAGAGFHVYGRSWLRPWTTYCFSPIVNRLGPKKTARFDSFNARLGECDLYTFANVFADYPLYELSSALHDVELIVDLGANVGAFSFLMHTLCGRFGCNRRIVALEPNAENVAFLRQQPFADVLEIHQAAVGPCDGIGRLVAGRNSVTHHVDLASSTAGETVPVVSLQSLLDRPALVKMDIEGGELAILESGLPDSLSHLVLEWHHQSAPADIVPGRWRKISTDIHGASTWYFCR